MNAKEKTGLIATVSMSALLAFQATVTHFSENSFNNKIDELEQDSRFVTLSPGYGKLYLNHEDLENPLTRQKIEISLANGFDKNSENWICTATKTPEIGTQLWYAANKKEGADKKIVFPKTNCINGSFLNEKPASPHKETPIIRSNPEIMI